MRFENHIWGLTKHELYKDSNTTGIYKVAAAVIVASIISIIITEIMIMTTNNVVIITIIAMKI